MPQNVLGRDSWVRCWVAPSSGRFSAAWTLDRPETSMTYDVAVRSSGELLHPLKRQAKDLADVSES